MSDPAGDCRCSTPKRRELEVGSGAEVRNEDQLIALVASGGGDPAYAAVFEALLRESHPLYRGLGTAAVVRIRGWLLLALGRDGLPDSALPFVLEELESGHDAYLSAAAAHVLRRSRPRSELVPALLAGLLYLRHRDDSVSLVEYGGYGTGGERTTAVAEILRTLGWLGHAGRAALPRLRELRDEPGVSPALTERVDRTIVAIEQAEPTEGACCCSSPLPQAGLETRPPQSPGLVAGVELQDQDGELLRFDDFFFGRPAIVAFFYTRCDNPTKCALTITRLGRVQRLLREAGLDAAIRTAAITYDPAYDRPARLARYAETWGARPDANHKMLRTVGPLDELRAYFDLGVNYASSVVNRHQIEAFVLDSAGRVATAATRRQWDETTLVKEAKDLL